MELIGVKNHQYYKGAEKGWFKKGHCYGVRFKKNEHCGKANWNWKGGRRYQAKDGYVYCYSFGHPRAHQNVILEHVLVAERKLGRFLKPCEKVHHINGIRNDNNPKNLIVCQTQKVHMSLHIGKMRKPRKHKLV